MTAEELFLSNLDVIENAARFVARRARLTPDDADDLASALKLRLIEDDYAVLRKFEGRCSLSTYVTSIAHRLFVDDWMHQHGRWRPSAEAQRLGDAAVLLEELLVRDRIPFAEALPVAQRVHPSLTKEEAAAIERRFPRRGPRPHVVPIDDTIEPAVGGETVETPAIEREKAVASERASRIVLHTLGHVDEEERVAIRLKFGKDMSVADIARALHCNQKQLYRRLDHIYDALRKALEREGFTAAEIRELIGAIDSHLDFGLREAEKETPRQAMHMRGAGSHEVPE